jgi:hypothetical protein
LGRREGLRGRVRRCGGGTPVIDKFTGVLAAADVFTACTAFWVMESIRLDLGFASRLVHEVTATAVATRIAVRDPLGDHLITSKNSAMAVIDYQPFQMAALRSMNRDLLLKNVVSTAKVAKLFGVPIVHSTINVRTGRGQPTLLCLS